MKSQKRMRCKNKSVYLSYIYWDIGSTKRYLSSRDSFFSVGLNVLLLQLYLSYDYEDSLFFFRDVWTIDCLCCIDEGSKIALYVKKKQHLDNT